MDILVFQVLTSKIYLKKYNQYIKYVILKPYVRKSLVWEENMFQNDYIMRMIREMVRTLIKLLCNIDTEKTEELKLEKESAEKLQALKKLVDNGFIESAEDQLLEEINVDNKQDFLTAVLFYQYLNEQSDDMLTAANFSREEVAEGLKTVAKIYGYESVLNTFLE